MVLAVEHADGTASTVQLAGKQGTRFYGGWLSEEERLGQTRCPSVISLYLTLTLGRRPFCATTLCKTPACASSMRHEVFGMPDIRHGNSNSYVGSRE